MCFFIPSHDVQLMGGTYGFYSYYRHPPPGDVSVHAASYSPTLVAIGKVPLNGMIQAKKEVQGSFEIYVSNYVLQFVL